MIERAHTALIAIALLALGATGAAAQEISYPEKCKMSGDMMAQHEQMEMVKNSAANKAKFQKEFMNGMNKTMPLMMGGMMKEDADVAFTCGMIAHHIAAIEMSKTELKHGDNELTKQMAQKIIDAQLKEIDEMSRWVEANVK